MEVGGCIQSNYAANEFSATFIGTSRIEEVGSCLFEDKENGLNCSIKFDKVRKRPSDYFATEILARGEAVSKVFGTYCGYI